MNIINTYLSNELYDLDKDIKWSISWHNSFRALWEQGVNDTLQTWLCRRIAFTLDSNHVDPQQAIQWFCNKTFCIRIEIRNYWLQNDTEELHYTHPEQHGTSWGLGSLDVTGTLPGSNASSEERKSSDWHTEDMWLGERELVCVLT